jgi:ArsR family transcriptional regulator
MPVTVPVLDHLTVLADPTRARMLAVLVGQELTVSELCDVVQLPQSTVSRHLKTLADGGWVTSRRDGTSRFYAIDDLPPVARRLWAVVRDQISDTPAVVHDEHRLKRVLADRRTASEEFFSSAAGHWDRVREDLFGTTSPLRALAGLFDERWVIGDLGCGTGQVTELVAPFVDRVVAVDASREMLQAARTRLRGVGNVEWRRGALEHLPLEDGRLDAALVFLVLHHVADPGAVLTEAARVVRPGGRVLVADMMPHGHEEYRQTMGHVWLGFSERQMARYFTAAGLGGVRWQALPADARARGPALFVATARKGAPASASPEPGDHERRHDEAEYAAP